MKEEMIKYLNSIHWSSARDSDIIEGFIKEFFLNYQPDRLNPEGLKKCDNSMGYKFGKNYINLSPCDSQNSDNKENR